MGRMQPIKQNARAHLPSRSNFIWINRRLIPAYLGQKRMESPDCFYSLSWPLGRIAGMLRNVLTVLVQLCQEQEIIPTNKTWFINTGALYWRGILNEPLEYFYSTAKNSHFLLFFIFLTWVIAIFLPCHFLMYHPLIHIKDKARCRIFSQLPCLSHCLVTHSLFQSRPDSSSPSLLIYIKSVTPLF